MPRRTEPPVNYRSMERTEAILAGKACARALKLGERGERVADVYMTARSVGFGHRRAKKDAIQDAAEGYGVPPWAISIAMQVLWLLLKRIWERRRRKQEESL